MHTLGSVGASYTFYFYKNGKKKEAMLKLFLFSICSYHTIFDFMSLFAL